MEVPNDLAEETYKSRNKLPFRPRELADKKIISGSSDEKGFTQHPQRSDHPKSPRTAEGILPSKEAEGNSRGQPREKTENTAKKAATASGTTMTELPDFIIERNKLFDKLKRERDAEILEEDHPAINVTLDLGLDSEGKPRPLMPVAAKAWESTPGSFLRHVDKSISSDVVIAKVDGKLLWDLDRPLEYACQVSYLPFTSAEGRNVFWHSSAHVLGEAAECQYQCLLSHGPPVEQGFFYDMALPDG